VLKHRPGPGTNYEEEYDLLDLIHMMLMHMQEYQSKNSSTQYLQH